MSTLEERLRAALSAKSDGVAFSMLTRSLPTMDPELTDTTPVLLPAPRHRPHQSRRIVATALAVAAVLLVAFGAVALHRATTPGTVGPAHVRPRSAIPWDQVGPGWTLVQETARATLTNGDHPEPAGTEQVQLVDPSEHRYQIYSPAAGWYLVTWDGQHRHAIFFGGSVEPSADHPYPSAKLMVVDLVDGNQHTFIVPSVEEPPHFSGDGKTVIFVALHHLERYDLTGQPQQPRRPIPSSRLAADSPDGRQAIVDGRAGLDVYDYDSGLRLGNLPPPKGYAGCYDPSWGGDGKLTASCLQAGDRTKVGTFVFSVNGVPAAGRADPQYAEAVGHRVTRLRQGPVSTFYPDDAKNPTPDSFPALTHLTASRLDTAGRTISIPVPAQVLATRSMIANSSPDAFTVVDLWGSSLGLSRHALSWNPFTGQVTELIHAATPTEAFVVVLPWGAQQY
jgi:hypothetical protein